MISEQEPIEKLIKLSVSRAKTFEQCPRRYYYNYEEHLPTKEWEHFDTGTYAHFALEIFHKYIISGSTESLRKLMSLASKEAYEKMVALEKTLSDEQLNNVKSMLSDYLTKIENEGVPNVLETEFPFTIPLTDKYDLTGVIDRIDREADGILHIQDYKTTKSTKYMDPFQLNAYGLLLLDKFPDAVRFRGSYIMLKLGCQSLSYDFTREDVDKCRNKLIQFADRIISEERWIAKPSKLCDWCDFKDVCLNSW